MEEKGENFYASIVSDEFVQKLMKMLEIDSGENSKVWKLVKKGTHNAKVYSFNDAEVGNPKLTSVKVEMDCKCSKEAFLDLLHNKMVRIQRLLSFVFVGLYVQILKDRETCRVE